MNHDIKPGDVVKLDKDRSSGFYVVEGDSKLGKGNLKLTPITIDTSREPITLTPELQSCLIPYHYF